MNDSFEALKEGVLAYPDFEKPFVVKTDVFKLGLEAVLT